MYFTISGDNYVDPGTGLPKREPDFAKGMACFRAALIIEPDYHPASFYLAEALIKTGKADEGVAMLQTLAKYNDDYGHFAQNRLAKMQAGAAK